MQHWMRNRKKSKANFFELRSDTANSRATALLLSAVARTLVIQTAEHFNMLDRLPV